SPSPYTTLVRSLVLTHQLNELVKQGRDVCRSRTGFRMPLKPECRHVSTADALQGSVKQRLVSSYQIGRQARLIHRKTVVLAGDHHGTIGQILNRMVCPMMALLHFQGL